jgi:hypothetical protein
MRDKLKEILEDNADYNIVDEVFMRLMRDGK